MRVVLGRRDRRQTEFWRAGRARARYARASRSGRAGSAAPPEPGRSGRMSRISRTDPTGTPNTSRSMPRVTNCCSVATAACAMAQYRSNSASAASPRSMAAPRPDDVAAFLPGVCFCTVADLAALAWRGARLGLATFGSLAAFASPNAGLRCGSTRSTTAAARPGRRALPTSPTSAPRRRRSAGSPCRAAGSPG